MVLVRTKGVRVVGRLRGTHLTILLTPKPVRTRLSIERVRLGIWGGGKALP